MHRSFKAIEADLLSAVDPGRWDKLTNELRRHVRTWQSVRTVVGLGSEIWSADQFYSKGLADLETSIHRIALMKEFFGIDSLSFSDMLLLSRVIHGLLERALSEDDVDEGLWSLRDFLQREQGQVVSREICVSDYDPDPSFRESYDNVVFTDGSWDDEISLYELRGLDPNDGGIELPPRGLHRWWIAYEEQFKDIELIRKMVGRDDIETHTLRNLQCTIQPYFSIPYSYYRCGLAYAIMATIRYLSQRSRFHVLQAGAQVL